MGTDVVVRGSTLDLTRAPDEQWNAEMVKMVAHQLFRGREVTKGELYYCLAVADAIQLNPLIGEVYFIPAKSRDGKGPTLVPYVGRNGLVRKAADRGYYYESETVHVNDKFRMSRRRDGTVEVTHSYGIEDRGDIVAAYAFLHRRDGSEKPSFFLAKLDEYLPTYDADWKMAASPWGNQRSAMIEKCAMIAAGRKRLDLGNVLADGELAIVDQMREVGPGAAPVPDAAAFDFARVTDDPELARELADAVARVEEVAPGAWPSARVEMVALGATEPQLRALLDTLRADAARHASRATQAREGQESMGAGDPSGGGPETAEGITDAQVIDDVHVHCEKLRRLISSLEDEMNEPGTAEDVVQRIAGEIADLERELAAIENPNQGRLV